MMEACVNVCGILVGYDPGGKGAHGVAEVFVEGGRARDLATKTFETTEQVIGLLEHTGSLVAFGVDTLTCWATGPGGWRPADRWLRRRYKAVQNSVVAPNSIRGSMALNGMAVLVWLKMARPSIFVTEVHPKVLFWHLTRAECDYTAKRDLMDATLARVLGVKVAPANEHEWDAALSAFVALEAVTARWTNDLHSLPTLGDERLVSPCGKTHYFWPE